MISKTSVFLGPLTLLAALCLLLYKTDLFIIEPIWTGFFTLCVLLSIVIVFLTFKDLNEKSEKVEAQIEKKVKETNDLRSVLDETHFLYREKIDKLEVNIAEIEAEARENLMEKEEELTMLQVGYKELHEQVTREKNQATGLQNSLNDALDLVRELRQKEYLCRENKAHIPSDLIYKHNQLKEQFVKKSQILKDTRYELFIKEGELEALKKDWEQKEEIFDETVYLENERLEEEIEALEAVIAKILEKKPRKSKKKLEEMLELPLEV